MFETEKCEISSTKPSAPSNNNTRQLMKTIDEKYYKKKKRECLKIRNCSVGKNAERMKCIINNNTTILMKIYENV